MPGREFFMKIGELDCKAIGVQAYFFWYLYPASCADARLPHNLGYAEGSLILSALLSF